MIIYSSSRPWSFYFVKILNNTLLSDISIVLQTSSVRLMRENNIMTLVVNDFNNFDQNKRITV